MHSVEATADRLSAVRFAAGSHSNADNPLNYGVFVLSFGGDNAAAASGIGPVRVFYPRNYPQAARAAGTRNTRLRRRPFEYRRKLR